MSLAPAEAILSPDMTAYAVETSVSAGDHAIDANDGLLSVAGPIMVTCYALLFAVAALTFFGSGSALFAVVISAALGLVFFAIPVLFLRTRAARDKRWRADGVEATSPVVQVWTGPIRRGEAITQIVSIPVAILLGFIMLALRWSLL